MGLLDLFANSQDPYDDTDRAQASADYQATAGGWREPTPPTIGRDYDPARDDDFTNGPRW